MEDSTLPKLLRRNYKRYGETKIAERVKDLGIWRGYTWKECYEKIKYLSLGLVSMGLKRGDNISILGENKPEWIWTELAAQAVGGAAVGIFTDCIASEVKYFVEHSDSKFIVVEDQEQVDKLLQIEDELPLLKKVVYWDPKGLWGYDYQILISLDQVMRLGVTYERENPNFFDQSIDMGKGNDLAIICYTSGTTGNPKGAMLTHEALISNASGWQQVDQWNDMDQYVSFVPPAWITEQALGIAGHLQSGMQLNFPEDTETVQENIREIGPQIIFLGPRLWENIVSSIQAKIIDTTIIWRSMYRLFLPIGYKRAKILLSKKKAGYFWGFLYFIADWVIFRPLRDQVGLLQTRSAYTAGSAVSPDILNYFHAIGVNIKQLYGGSEAGLVTLHRNEAIKWETSGTIMPNVEIKISDEGEIMVGGPNIFSGYYKDPKSTAEKVQDGWYRSGDFGYLDEDNHLVVVDRMDDLRRLKGGQKFSPQYNEVRLRFCPYIRDALVVGSTEKDYVVGIINIDIENAGRWAEARQIPYTTFTDLSQKPEVLDLIKGYIQKINETLPEWMQIMRFVNLHKEFDADESELTRTRKLRRVFVEDRYKDLIHALYSDKDKFSVDTIITYRDGKTSKLKTSIRIVKL